MARIAIIGSGISSLTAAYRLSKSGHEVHVFEAAERLGGHTATVDVTTGSGAYAIDTGFIVFNDWTYPNFIALMSELGVKWKDSLMSFSVKSERTGLEYNGDGFRKLFAQKKNLLNFAYLRMLTEILRFNRESIAWLARFDADGGGRDGDSDVDLTLGAFLRDGGYSEMFAENYILPMGAAIWSSSFTQMLDFPLRFFVRFFKNHGMLSVDERPIWKVIGGGSRSYLGPISAPFRERVHLSSPVDSVSRTGFGVKLSIGGASPREFAADYVVIGAHSDQALRLLSDPTPREREILGAIRYQTNETILHTDVSVLPRNKIAWAAWNYLVPEVEAEKVPVTYHMNILQGFRSPENFLVSLNLTGRLDPAKILRRFSYDHPVFDAPAIAAQARWEEISNRTARTYYCGAYWSYGFHEDGVKSGLRVAEALGSAGEK